MAQLTNQQTFDLALRYHMAGRLPEAEQLYRQILVQQPDHAGVWHYLGVMACQVGRNDAGADLIRRAVALKPDYAEAHNNLGNALQAMGQWDEAIAACRQAIAIKPNYPEAHNNLGNALQAKGQLDEAIAAFRQAIVLHPSYDVAHNNLGNALQAKGRLDEAIAAFRQAIAFKPGFPEAHNNLGNVLRAKGQLDEALAAYRQAIALNPNYPDAHMNLGNALQAKGYLDEAIAAYRQALALKPDFPKAHSNLLLSLHYHPGFDGPTIAQEHRRWNQSRHAGTEPSKIQPHANDRSPNRRLRIGYVSPDFREHVVGRFVLPLFANHDHQVVEVFAYAQVAQPDAMTERLRSHADQWRSLVGLSDQQAADLIRQDRIDILVDLAGHTADSRLLVFAHKPAPVQVTYLGYPASTGLDTIDYRLTDAVADPPGLADTLHCEQLVRLPQTAWCFQPPSDTPAVSQSPVVSNGYLTFGTFNNFAKVSQVSLQLWARILQRVPGSRLLLKGPAMTSPDVVGRLRNTLGNIAPERLVLAAHEPSLAKHFQWYERLDIALDTFPYHGTTTTCEALWMGVPVVTLAGQTHVSRVGASLLSSVGLADLVGHSQEQYVQIAVDLANDPSRLKKLRSTLRPRMEASPLMDAPRFARSVEAAYRQMWRKWCAAT